MGVRHRPLEAEFLRNARRMIGLTQRQLAEASREFPHPITREFVAGLESRGLYGTVRKFLTYWQLTKFDLRVLADLAVLGHTEPASVPDVPRLIERTRELCEAGELREALALALAGARRAEADRRESDRARCLLAASIAAAKAQHWTLARELVEEALASEALSTPNAIRAKIQYAGVMSAMGRHSLALDILRSIAAADLTGVPDVAARYWHNTAILLRARGDLAGALRAARRAGRLYDRLNDTSGDGALALAVQADCLSQQGDPARARALARKAIERADRTTNFLVRCRTLYTAGLVALEADDLDAADLHLRRCIRLAERIGYMAMACEARIERLRLELKRGRKSAALRLLAKLNKEMRLYQLDRESRRRFERLSAQLRD